MVLLSKTTHFLSVFFELGVVQQCTEAQAGVVPDGLKEVIGRKESKDFRESGLN